MLSVIPFRLRLRLRLPRPRPRPKSGLSVWCADHFERMCQFSISSGVENERRIYTRWIISSCSRPLRADVLIRLITTIVALCLYKSNYYHISHNVNSCVYVHIDGYGTYNYSSRCVLDTAKINVYCNHISICNTYLWQALGRTDQIFISVSAHWWKHIQLTGIFFQNWCH